MRITANSAIDFVRRRQSGRFVPLEECEPVLKEPHRFESRAWRENPEASYARKERLCIIADRIAELPAELRRVCFLRNVMELSTEEVATRLGISTAAVRLRLFRAHGRMKKGASCVSKDGRLIAGQLVGAAERAETSPGGAKSIALWEQNGMCSR